MAKVFTNETNLHNIGDAIREKNGSNTTYKPSEMAAAIDALPVYPEPTGTKAISSNGVHDVKDYANANVDVPNSYAAGDEGKVVSSGALVSQTSVTKNANGTYDTTTNNEVVVNVPNTYGSGDEGKVVSNGALASQGSQTITQNGTYDTTLIGELIANISGGGGSGGSISEEWDFTSQTPLIGKNHEAQVSNNSNVTFDSDGATFVNGGYINTGKFGLPKTTIELETGDFVQTSGSHRRFIMTGASSAGNGLIYRSTGVWSFYNGSWYESGETDASFFDNCTVKVVVGTDNKWHIYKNGTLWWEPNAALEITKINIGSTGGSVKGEIKNLKITGEL